VPVTASAILACLAPQKAKAQTAQDLVGSWTLVSATIQQSGGPTESFGPNPLGTLIFGPDGRYALIFLRRDLPKVASNNRASQTAEESKANAQGTIGHFGTYRVDAADKSLILRIEGSTFANWIGAEQRRPFSLSGDELTYTSPGSTGTPAKVVMRRVK
jgi:Lipocalin-like domain